MAAYSTSAVSVTGLLPQLASPRRRKRLLGRLGITSTALWGEVPLPEAPTVRWLMGVRDPSRWPGLSRRHWSPQRTPAAQGAADRALAHPVREQRQSPRS